MSNSSYESRVSVADYRNNSSVSGHKDADTAYDLYISRNEESDSIEDDDKIVGFSDLPTPLCNLRLRQFSVAALLIICSVGFSIALHDWHIYIFSLLSLWFIFSGISMEQRYRRGDIVEQALLCTGVRKSLAHDFFSVTFRTNEEIPAYFQFQVAGKHNIEKFVPNTGYIIYYEKSNPSYLLTFAPI